MSKKEKEQKETEKIEVNGFEIDELKLMYQALGTIQIQLDTPLADAVIKLRKKITDKAQTMVNALAEKEPEKSNNK